MHISDGIAASTPLDERRYGYMYTLCDVPKMPAPTYWGEIEFRNGADFTSVRFLIGHFNNADKNYEISLFKDRWFEDPIIEAIVEFYDHDARLVNPEIVSIKQDWTHVSSELLRVAHIVAYECLVERICLRPSLRKALPTGVIFYLNNRNVPDDIHEQLGINLEQIIPTVKTLLG